MSDFINGAGNFAFDDKIPRPGPEIFILRLKGNSAKTCTILAEKISGIWCHFNPKSNCSEPHYEDAEQCPGCQAKRQKRWKGYLHVFAHEMGQEVFLELTPHSASSLQNQLGGPTKMRGNRIRIERTKGDNGRLIVHVLTAAVNMEVLPAEKLPHKSILKLWGYEMGEDGHWEAPSPQ